jgi:hypothetical protein
VNHRFIWAAVLSSLVGACSSCASPQPAKWALKLESDGKCGMTVSEVEALTRQRVVPRDNPSQRGSHVIRDGLTDAWLQFDDEKLQWVQIHKVVKLKRMESRPRIEFCPA